MEAGQIAKIRGNDCMRSGDYSQAVEEYTKAVNVAGKTAVLMGNRAQAYLNLGRFNEALDDAMQATSLDPLYIKGYHRQGKALEGLGRFTEAGECYRKIGDFEPGNKEGKEGVERCLRSECQAPAATLDLKVSEDDLAGYMTDSVSTISSLLSTIKSHREAGLSLLQSEDYSQAQQSFESALQLTTELTPSHPDSVKTEQSLLFSALGDTYKGLKNLKLAIDYHSTAIRLGKNTENEAELYYKRALMYKELGNIEFTKADLTQSLLLKPDFTPATQVLTRILQQEQAEKERLERVKMTEIQNVVTQASSFKDRGNVAFTRRDYDAATQEFSNGLATILSKEHVYPDLSSNTDIKLLKIALFSNRAACSLELNCNTLAIKDCKEVLSIDDRSIKAHYRLAQAYSNCGQFGLAIEQVEKALEVEPGNKTFVKELESLRKKQSAVGEMRAGNELPKRKGQRKVSFKDFAAPGYDASSDTPKSEDLSCQIELNSPQSTDIASPNSANTPVTSSKWTETPQKPDSVDSPIEFPSSLTSFQSQIYSLRTDFPRISTYLQSFPASSLISMCQNSPLDVEILLTLLKTLHFLPSELILTYLTAFPTTNRFSLNIKMLTKSDKSELKTLIDGLKLEPETENRLLSQYNLGNS